MINKRCALLVNFTANSYHFGCYGTSLEIYETLHERGYYVNWLSVSDTHGLRPSPELLTDFDDVEFAKRFFDGNRTLFTMLNEADVVVVNGEGTLHGLHNGPRNLLYIMYAARKYLGKPIHLINHSCYPSDGKPLSEPSSTLYGGVLRVLHRVVVRETRSAAVLHTLGVGAQQGFDCLPRFIARHRVTQYAGSKSEGPLLLSGSVAMSDVAATRIAKVVSRFIRPGQVVRFLSGAKMAPALEDELHAARMHDVIPALEVVAARSMSEWLDEINQAACLVSGRFHHTLAAAMLGTPVVAFPSNTPKIESICDMLGLTPPLVYDSPNFEATLAARLDEVLNHRSGCISAAARDNMLALSEQNFSGL